MSIQIEPKDIVINTYDPVPGNWNVPRLIGIQVIHLPTGTVASSDTERTVYLNREKALADLRIKVKEAYKLKEEEEQATYRRTLYKVARMLQGCESNLNTAECVEKVINMMINTNALTSQHSVNANAEQEHPDNLAVNKFAKAMQHKLAIARDKGRQGWEDCDPIDLSNMLREHVEKGDPVDVANFCMFLWNKEYGIYKSNIKGKYFDISKLVKRLREADKPLMQQNTFSEVRALLREAADVLERIIAGDVYVADGKAGIDEAIDHARLACGGNHE